MGSVGGDDGMSVQTDDSESQKRSMLSDAVMRKLKYKNVQLDEELREKKRQMEDIVRNVTSWKKSIKDRQSTKLQQLEMALKSKVHQERERGLRHKTRLIRSVAKRYRMLTKMACLHHWQQRVQIAKAKGLKADAEGRMSSSEQMVAFLKEQLAATGKAHADPEGHASAAELHKVNCLLIGLLTQIPSGSVAEFDEDAILQTYGGGADEGGAVSKVGMVWAEIRELVNKRRGETGAGGGQVSNELAVARLRGKIDHMNHTVKAREHECASLREELSKESPAKIEALSKECALANVMVKELEQRIKEATAALDEKDSQIRQVSARVGSLSAALHSKEEEGAMLSGLRASIEELYETARTLDDGRAGAEKRGGDPFFALKHVGTCLEGLRVKNGDLEGQVGDSMRRLEMAQGELSDAVGRIAQLQVVQERVGELEVEVKDLKEGGREADLQLQRTLGELDAARLENATLQTQAQQMLRDAERVSALARERAHALEEKAKVIEGLQKSQQEGEVAQLTLNDELATVRIELARAREEGGAQSARLQAEAHKAQIDAKALTSRLDELNQELSASKQALEQEREESEKLTSQVRANSVALRERDAAQVRAHIEQQSLVKLQGEMKALSGELAMARDRAEERGARVAELETELKSSKLEAAGKAAEINSLRTSGGGGGNVEGKAVSGGGGGGGAWEADMLEVLRDVVRCEREEVGMLQAMVRLKGKEGGGKESKEEGGAEDTGGGAGGVLGGGCGGHTVDDWKKLASQGLDGYGFGQYGIKRPLMMAVRNTYFGKT